MKIKTLVIGTMIFSTLAFGFTGCNNSDVPFIEEEITINTSDLIKDFEVTGLVDFTSVNNITDKEIKESIEEYLQNNVVYKHINEGVITENSIININYTGTINGSTFNGSNIENYFLNISNNDLMNGFAEQCVGHSVGDVFDVEINFPQDYRGTYTNSEGKEMPLSGITAIYSVKINYIAGDRYLIYDELDDDVIYDLTGGYYDTLEKFYNATKQDLINKKSEKLEYEMWKKLVQNVKYDNEYKSIIAEKVEEEYQNQLNYYSEMANYYEVELNVFITENLGYKNEEEYNKVVKENAEYTVKQDIIVDYLANKNKLVIDSKNYTELATNLAKEYGYATLSDFESQYTKEEINEFLQYNLITDYLKENNGYVK